MEYRVKITPTALADGESFYLRIEAFSPQNAAAWFNGLLDAVDTLATMPQRCPIAPETQVVGQEIRCLFYKKHYRILYEIEGDVVTIYHIRHTSQAAMTREEFLRSAYQDDVQ